MSSNMATNKELVEQAVAAIPLWRAFLDQKEAEQDAILAEMRNENPNESKPKKLIKKLTARFRSQPAASAQQALSSSGKETQNRMSELPKVEVKASSLPRKPVVETPVNDKAENNQKNNAENDLLDKEVEVNLPIGSPTSTNSQDKKVPTPIVPATTSEKREEVSEDHDNNDGDDNNESNFKDIF